MVTASLSNYLAFQYTSFMFDQASNALDSSSSGWLDTAYKIGEMILRVISLIPLFVFDLLMIAASSLYTDFFENQQFAPQDDTELDNRGPLRIFAPIEPFEEPPKNLMQKILNAPPLLVEGGLSNHMIRKLTDKPGFYKHTNINFFKTAIEDGLKFLAPQDRKVYLELIENDGVLDVEEDTPVEIFQWLNKCMIIHYLRAMCSHTHPSHLFPRTPLQKQEATDSEAERHKTIEHRDYCRIVSALAYKFRNFDGASRALIVHQVLCAEPQLEKSGQIVQFIQDLNRGAFSLTQDSIFIDKMLWPCLRRFKILIKESGVLDQ